MLNKQAASFEALSLSVIHVGVPTMTRLISRRNVILFIPSRLLCSKSYTSYTCKELHRNTLLQRYIDMASQYHFLHAAFAVLHSCLYCNYIPYLFLPNGPSSCTHCDSYKATSAAAGSYLGRYRAAAILVFCFMVLLVEFLSCSGVWQFLMCAFAARDAPCLVVG